MSSTMETMTMTRKVMWRFESSLRCCVEKLLFTLGSMGGQECESPGVLTGRSQDIWELWRRVWRPQLGLEPSIPFYSLSHNLMMVPIRSETGTEMSGTFGQ